MTPCAETCATVCPCVLQPQLQAVNQELRDKLDLCSKLLARAYSAQAVYDRCGCRAEERGCSAACNESESDAAAASPTALECVHAFNTTPVLQRSASVCAADEPFWQQQHQHQHHPYHHQQQQAEGSVDKVSGTQGDTQPGVGQIVTSVTCCAAAEQLCSTTTALQRHDRLDAPDIYVATVPH